MKVFHAATIGYVRCEMIPHRECGFAITMTPPEGDDPNLKLPIDMGTAEILAKVFETWAREARERMGKTP